MRANEEWRNDPARRQAAQDELQSWYTAAERVKVLLSTALQELKVIGVTSTEPEARILDGVYNEIHGALGTVSRFNESPINETRIGNAAAFGVGWNSA